MVDLETAREKFLSLPGAVEEDHFGKPSYRVNKKIFATLWLNEKRAMLKLSPDQQIECCDGDSSFFPVPGVWGKQGNTFVDLNRVNVKSFTQALTVAWCGVAPKKLVEAFKEKNK